MLVDNEELEFDYEEWRASVHQIIDRMFDRAKPGPDGKRTGRLVMNQSRPVRTRQPEYGEDPALTYFEGTGELSFSLQYLPR